MNDYADLVRKMDDDALVDLLACHANADGYSIGCGVGKEAHRKVDVCKAELRRRLAAKKEGKA